MALEIVMLERAGLREALSKIEAMLRIAVQETAVLRNI
jgi:hypothetical protein